MTLDDCIALALENNLDLRIQRLTRTAAAIDAEGTRGAYDPSLALSAKRSRTETEGTAAGTSENSIAMSGFPLALSPAAIPAARYPFGKTAFSSNFMLMESPFGQQKRPLLQESGDLPHGGGRYWARTSDLVHVRHAL